MFFSKLKEKLSGAGKLLSGRKDALEAVCAAAALVAAADGEISDKEIETAKKVVVNNATLGAAYKAGEIDKCIDAMLKRAQGGRSGRLGLYKEIDDIASAAEALREVVLACAVDIAEADGKTGPEEQKALQEIAKRVSINLSTIMAV